MSGNKAIPNTANNSITYEDIFELPAITMYRVWRYIWTNRDNYGLKADIWKPY